jgi:two-component system, OmpR family, response regulator
MQLRAQPARVAIVPTADRVLPFTTAGAGPVRLLIVEDEAAMRGFLERSLREELFHVEAVADGESAESHALAGGFDAIVLDVMLPDHDGFTVCRRLRTRGVDTPILLLTGRHGVADRIRGLDIGADDYLGKPFAFEELLARLRAITRRGRSRQLSATLSCGPLELDQQTRDVTVDKSAVVLSDTEFRLLRYLLLRAGKPVSRDDLAQHVWDDDDSPGSNVIDVYISYLRKRLGRAGPLIRTVRGVGYTIATGGCAT